MRAPHAHDPTPPTVMVDGGALVEETGLAEETAFAEQTAFAAQTAFAEQTAFGEQTAMADFAFADTVVARDLDEAIPPSGVVIHNGAGLAHCVTLDPHAPIHATFAPLHPMRARDGWTAKMRLAWDRMREGVQASRAEMNELWSATACLEHVHDGQGAIVHDEDPLARAATVGRRVRTFFSFFEWDRADLLRAAWIGLLVFVVVATVGAAFALESAPNPTTADMPTSAR